MLQEFGGGFAVLPFCLLGKEAGVGLLVAYLLTHLDPLIK